MARHDSLRIEEVIGDNIAVLRRGMTQAELGQRVGKIQRDESRAWSNQAVSQAEKGLRAFTIADLYLVAAALETSIPRLLRLPEPEPGNTIGLQVAGMSVAPADFEHRTGNAAVVDPGADVRDGVQRAFRDVNSAQAALVEVLQTFPVWFSAPSIAPLTMSGEQPTRSDEDFPAQG